MPGYVNGMPHLEALEDIGLVFHKSVPKLQRASNDVLVSVNVHDRINEFGQQLIGPTMVTQSHKNRLELAGFVQPRTLRLLGKVGTTWLRWVRESFSSG